MKKLKISLLALSALAGGSLVASAAPAPLTGGDYGVSIEFTNPAPTSIFYVDDTPLPDVSSTAIVFQLVPNAVSTDESGKIDGATTLRILSLSGGTTNGATNAVADVVCTVTGNMGLKGTTPTANISIKGNGASVDSAGVIGAASVALKFSGSPTNLTATGIAPFAGTFSGTVKFGLKSVNGGKTINVDKTTPGSARGHGETLSYFGRVVASGSKFYTVGDLSGVFAPANVTGSGSVNEKKGSYSVNVKGFGAGKGATMTFSGDTATSTNVWVTIGTNTTEVTLSVPAKATANGKIAGQSVKKVPGGIVTVFPSF